MKIYQVRGNSNEYQTLTCSEADYELFSQFVGTPQLERWQPVRVQVFRSKQDPKPMKVGDCPTLDLGVPIFSRRAVEALRDLLTPGGELLPLLCDEGEYFAYNVTAVLDALDHEKSVINRFSSGRIMNITSFAFRPEAIGDHAIFKIPELPDWGVFVTDRFVARVREKGLEGFLLPTVWEAP